MDERRKYVRLDTRLKITYNILEKEGGPQQSETRDISGGGIRLFLDDPIAEKTLLQITIQLPEDPTPIRCVGKVVWVESFSVLQGEKKEDQYEAGVIFTDIEQKDRDRIIKYVILGYATENS